MDAKLAATQAMTHVAQLYGSGLIQDLLLEEVERLDDGNWLVTVSFMRPSEVEALKANLLGQLPKRHYKAITVSNQSGDMMSMQTPHD